MSTIVISHPTNDRTDIEVDGVLFLDCRINSCSVSRDIHTWYKFSGVVDSITSGQSNFNLSFSTKEGSVITVEGSGEVKDQSCLSSS